MLKKEKCEAAEQHNMLQLSTTITRQRIAPTMYRHKTTHRIMARIAANILKSFCRLFRMVTSSLQNLHRASSRGKTKKLVPWRRKCSLLSIQLSFWIAQKNKMLLKKPIRFESLVPLPRRQALLLQLTQSGGDTKIDSPAPAASLPVTCSLKSLANMMKL